MSKQAWVIADLKVKITPGIVWFYVYCVEGPILRLESTYTRPTKIELWKTVRGVRTFCGYTWKFLNYGSSPPVFRSWPSWNIFAMRYVALPNTFWVRWWAPTNVDYKSGRSPIFEIITPDCPPPGYGGMTLIVGPPPPITGDGNATITLTPSVV